MKKIFMNSEFITLTQFLKMEGFINSGGEAKFFLLDNKVYLNGLLENRRGKKIYKNDKLEIEKKEYIFTNEN